VIGLNFSSYKHIQGVPGGGKVNIMGGHYKQNLYMHMCPIPKDFRNRDISLYNTLYTEQTSNIPCK
jgi:hypothetical protein